MIFYMISYNVKSYVCGMISYLILYASPIQPGSNATPGWFKCYPV